MVEQRMESVSFGAKGQVVIPRRLRREFEIEEGTRALVEATPEGIMLKPITAKFIHGLRGSWKGKGVLKGLREERKAEREGGGGE